MNYTEAIDWLENIPISFDSNYDGYELKLVNIAKFLEQLGNPQNDLSLIHVGGTNGKGSTCHIISSILQEHGFNVGLFSSPHMYDFRERIKINSNYIDKDFILEFINHNKNYITKNNLSFFETSFSIALCYFKKIKPEYVIIEVGLGGRLDATNIINPLISVITNISYDHTEILGNTLQKIATEKAGIFKKNSKIIIGERNSAVDEIFIKKAEEISSKITFVSDYNDQKEYSNVNYLNTNIKTAIYTCKALNLENIDNNSIMSGISNINKNCYLIGRWSSISENPKVIFDAAHNLAGFKIISSQLKKVTYNKLHVILGFVKGKNIKELIAELPAASNVYYTSLKMERGMTQNEIRRNVGGNIIFDDNTKRLIEVVKMDCTDKDLILITGSNFIAKNIHEK